MVRFRDGDYSSNGASIRTNKEDLSLSLIGGTAPNQNIAAEGAAYVGRGGSSSAANWDGRIYAVICVETTLSTSERDDVEEWLYGKAGIEDGRLGLATETDAALAVTAQKTRALGVATETDTALAAAASKTPGLGVAQETDVALAVSGTKAVVLGVAQETDTALAATPTLSIRVSVGKATETNTATAVQAAKRRRVGQAQERSSAGRMDFGLGAFFAELHDQTGASRVPSKRRLRPLVFTDRADGQTYILMRNDSDNLLRLEAITPRRYDEVFPPWAEPTTLVGETLVRVYVSSGQLQFESTRFDTRNRPILFGKVRRPYPDQPRYRLALRESAL